MTDRFTEHEMYTLAASAVAKVDLHGERGSTLCSMDEVIAMAMVLALHDVIPKPHERMPKNG